MKGNTMDNNEFVNVYIQGLVDEAVENTKMRLVNQARFKFVESQNQTLISQLQDLETKYNELKIHAEECENDIKRKDTEYAAKIKEIDILVYQSGNAVNVYNANMQSRDNEVAKRDVIIANLNHEIAQFKIANAEIQRQLQTEIEYTKKAEIEKDKYYAQLADANLIINTFNREIKNSKLPGPEPIKTRGRKKLNKETPQVSDDTF